MLVFGEEAVTFYMLQNTLSNDGLHSLACNAANANRSIVDGQGSRSILYVLVLFWLVFMTQVGSPPPAISGILRAGEHLGCRIVP